MSKQLLKISITKKIEAMLRKPKLQILFFWDPQTYTMAVEEIYRST